MREPTLSVVEQRKRYALLLVVLAVLVAGANLYLAVYMGEGPCGGTGDDDPSAGSPLQAYCAFLLESSDSRIVALLALLFYGPTLLLVVGGVAAITRRSVSGLKGTTWISVAWLTALVLPTFLLPA